MMTENYDFSYLIEKVKNADFEFDPFKHIYIEDFFSNQHFDEITSCTEILSPVASTDTELINGLVHKGFKPISFPGCVTNIKKYVNWHEQGKRTAHHSACEGFGMALRLFEFQSVVLEELNTFIASEEFNRVIAEKFEVNYDNCLIDGGIQKYLDGYEISPHPDIRKKAATFMVNINPSSDSEAMSIHTHYLKLKKEYEFVSAFWSGNSDVDRSWVPWDWADTVKLQTRNNSIVLFSPSNNTLHGVKASYNHLNTQRTQLYGNLWFKTNPATKSLAWEQLDLVSKESAKGATASIEQKIVSLLPDSVIQKLKKVMGISSVGKRNV
jgi:hypothetical protein